MTVEDVLIDIRDVLIDINNNLSKKKEQVVKEDKVEKDVDKIIENINEIIGENIDTPLLGKDIVKMLKELPEEEAGMTFDFIVNQAMQFAIIQMTQRK